MAGRCSVLQRRQSLAMSQEAQGNATNLAENPTKGKYRQVFCDDGTLTSTVIDGKLDMTRPPLFQTQDKSYTRVVDEYSKLTQVTLNVSGKKFKVYKEFLQRYPTTLLGSPELENYYDVIHGDYFFDKNREAFEQIFDFYLYGMLYPPKNTPDELWRDTVEFFRIMSVFDKVDREIEEKAEQAARVEKENMSVFNRARGYISNAMDNPSSCLSGMIWGWMDLGFIFLSIVCIMVETIPDVKSKVSVNGSWEQKLSFILETITVSFFTLDIITRLLTTNDRTAYLRSPATWLDVFTIVPYFLELFIDVSKFATLKVLRIARIIRVMKLVKKNKRLLLIATVMSQSVSELGMLVIVWGMCISVAGTTFFYIEAGNNNLVNSGIDGLWWAVVTMSTVGYGDIYPKTVLGQLFATCFVYIGMVFLALPLTIIVSVFSKHYESRYCYNINKGKKQEGTF